MPRKKTRIRKDKKTIVGKVIDIALSKGWEETPTDTLIKKEKNTFLRFNFRDKKKITLEKKIIHNKKEMETLRKDGKPCKVSHWEIIKECKYEDVVIEDNDIKL